MLSKTANTVSAWVVAIILLGMLAWVVGSFVVGGQEPTEEVTAKSKPPTQPTQPALTQPTKLDSSKLVPILALEADRNAAAAEYQAARAAAASLDFLQKRMQDLDASYRNAINRERVLAGLHPSCRLERDGAWDCPTVSTTPVATPTTATTKPQANDQQGPGVKK